MSETLTVGLPELRLRGARSQIVFDAVLRSLAEPGTVRHLPAELSTAVPASAWLALALCDVDVPVAVVGPGSEAVASAINDATDAPVAAPEAAAVVVVTAVDALTPELLAAVPTGTAWAPELGARLAIPASVTGSSETEPVSDVVLTGPGVPGQRQIQLGLPSEIVRCLGQASGSFPTGFDTWIFGQAEASGIPVVGIPRSTTISTDQSARES